MREKFREHVSRSVLGVHINVALIAGTPSTKRTHYRRAHYSRVPRSQRTTGKRRRSTERTKRIWKEILTWTPRITSAVYEQDPARGGFVKNQLPPGGNYRRGDRRHELTARRTVETIVISRAAFRPQENIEETSVSPREHPPSPPLTRGMRLLCSPCITVDFPGMFLSNCFSLPDVACWGLDVLPLERCRSSGT